MGSLDDAQSRKQVAAARFKATIGDPIARLLQELEAELQSEPAGETPVPDAPDDWPESELDANLAAGGPGRIHIGGVNR